jgi:hypothetical protein
MDILKQPFAAGVMMLVSLLSMPAADAQTQSPSPTEQAQPSPPQQAPSITDQKLDQTAAAMKRVVSVKQDYQQRIKERIAEEGGKELAKAVTDQGLSLEEYAAILEVAQKDPDVLQKLKQRMGSSAK